MSQIENLAANSFAVDTSVVVAGLASWHPDHGLARGVLAQRPVAIGHVLIESYAVLTRLPSPRKLGAGLAWQVLDRAFPHEPVALTPVQTRSLVEEISAASILGGATYDALVAATARCHSLRLFTLDRRARSTYLALGADVHFVGE